MGRMNGMKLAITRPQESMGLLKWTLINEAKKTTKLINREPYEKPKDDAEILSIRQKTQERMWIIDHVVKRHSDHYLHPDVLHLSVSIIDRMLEEDDIYPADYMLMADTALYIAFRFSGNALFYQKYKPKTFFYSLDDVFAMESHILACTDFEVTPPADLPVKYYHQLADIVYLNPTEFNFGLYFMELCYCERSLSHYSPLVYGAAILYITLRLTRKRYTWGSFMMKITGLDTEDLCPVVQEMAETILKVRNYHFAPSIREKYAQLRYMSVSVLPHLKSDVLPKLAKTS